MLINNIISVIHLISIIIILLLILQYIQHIREAFIENSVMPNLTAGLGNQLFNIATAFGISKSQNKVFALNNANITKSGHSDINYMDTIFEKFKQYSTTDPHQELIPNSENHITIPNKYKNNKNALLVQESNHDYKNFDAVREEFIKMLTFNTSITSKYPRLHESAFIHIRGGDFKGLGGSILLGLEKYYERAIQYCLAHNVRHFYIFTNDMPYIKEKFPFILDTDHTVVNENEINSLYLMSQCQLGGISSNGTFGWWGLYLNIQRPNLIIPSQWGTDPSSKTYGLDYPGFVVIDV